jgi:hypothetical protein
MLKYFEVNCFWEKMKIKEGNGLFVSKHPSYNWGCSKTNVQNQRGFVIRRWGVILKFPPVRATFVSKAWIHYLWNCIGSGRIETHENFRVSEHLTCKQLELHLRFRQFLYKNREELNAIPSRGVLFRIRSYIISRERERERDGDALSGGLSEQRRRIFQTVQFNSELPHRICYCSASLALLTSHVCCFWKYSCWSLHHLYSWYIYIYI